MYPMCVGVHAETLSKIGAHTKETHQPIYKIGSLYIHKEI